MGKSFDALSESIHEFLQQLSPQPATHADSENADQEPPRLDLIDFDKLQTALTDVVQALAAAKELEQDAEYVKRWLALRINAIRRGRQAMLSERVSGKELTAESGLSLAEHLRLYDEESGQLKKELRKSDKTRGALSRSQKEQYRQFRA
jgi:hypothetical protein